MKIDKIERNIIIGLAILIITTIGLRMKRDHDVRIHKPIPFYVRTTEVKELPQNVRELSKKYHTYEDLYKSDKLTLVYNYTTYENPLGRDQNFHKKLSALLDKENLDIETIVFKDWQDDTFEIALKNKSYITDTEKCGPGGEEEVQLKSFIDKSQLCINNVCLIDVKNHKYTLITADPDFVIETIKNYNSPKQ